MRKSLIKQAKTKDEAIRLALQEANRTRSEVEIEVLEEGSSGFLGIGAKDAVVRISYDEDISDSLFDFENEIRGDYNVADRSKYFEEEARATYDEEEKFHDPGIYNEKLRQENEEFEKSLHDIKEEDDLGEYDRLQKINSYEENARGHIQETEDLSKELDKRIDALEHREVKEEPIENVSSVTYGSGTNEPVIVEIEDEEEIEDDDDFEVITIPTSNDSLDANEEIQLEEDIDEDFKASENHKKQQTDIDKYYQAKEFLEEILEAMHFENATVYGNLEGNTIKLDAKVDENDTGIAIGKSGVTLDALELIVRKSIDSRANNLRVNLDINNYKKRRDEKIRELAADTARKVQRSKKSWNLKYMNSYERRLAHEEIGKFPNVTSHSEGQEPKRYVVVSYVSNEEE